MLTTQARRLHTHIKFILTSHSPTTSTAHHHHHTMSSTATATTSFKLTPGTPFPQLTVDKIGGGKLTLGGTNDKWQLIYIYRGKHCPICVRFLPKLSDMVDKFAGLNIAVTAVSADGYDKVTAMTTEGQYKFTTGYNLTVDQMRQLGLYISAPRTPPETDRPFAEPAMFIVKPDGNIQVVSVANNAGVRPDLEFAYMSIAYVMQHNLGPSGTY